MENENNKKNIFRPIMNNYLEQINSFSLKKIEESDLIDLQETDEISIKTRRYLDYSIFYQFTIFFEEKTSEKFSNFLQILYRANSSNVYLWSKFCRDCGICLLDSVLDINTQFSFECSDDIFILTTADMQDKILFDFYEKSERRLLDIQLFGTNWSKIRWEI